LTDSIIVFYITNAFPGRYCIFYVIGHIVVFLNSISVCVGLCIYVPVLLLVFVILLVNIINYRISYHIIGVPVFSAFKAWRKGAI